MAVPARPPEDHRLDYLTRVRRRGWPFLHRLVRRFGGFAQCVMDPAEYVGRIERGLDRFQDDLRAMGFTREPISALKLDRDGRKSAGSWVYRASIAAEKQLHVTIFTGRSGAIDVYAHWEYSWITNPVKHYRGVGWDTAAGVTTMVELLATRGIEPDRG